MEKGKGKDVIKIRCDSQALANLFHLCFHRHTLIPSLYQLGTQEIKPSLNFEGEQRRLAIISRPMPSRSPLAARSFTRFLK